MASSYATRFNCQNRTQPHTPCKEQIENRHVEGRTTGKIVLPMTTVERVLGEQEGSVVELAKIRSSSLYRNLFWILGELQGHIHDNLPMRLSVVARLGSVTTLAHAPSIKGPSAPARRVGCLTHFANACAYFPPPALRRSKLRGKSHQPLLAAETAG